jgi:hypothetical protein
MAYTDHYKYEASRLLKDNFNKLRDAAKADKPQLFVNYCRKAITAKEASKMPLRDAAYSIAGVMFMTELDEPLFESLTGLAGELELPTEFVSGNPEKKWQELLALVDEYEKAHKTEDWLDNVEQEQAAMELRTKEAFEEHGDK